MDKFSAADTIHKTICIFETHGSRVFSLKSCAEWSVLHNAPRLMLVLAITIKLDLSHEGDILPVVKYFQFAGRLRRFDMTNPLEQIRVIVSRHIPHALFLCQSRVANIVADNLAGQASNFIRERYRRCPAEFNRYGGPVSIRPTFPTPLLQVGGFKIQCSDQTCTYPCWILVERPRLDHGLLRKHLTLHPLHRQLIEGYLSPCLPQNSSIEVDYSPRSFDNQGRKYCCVIGGQRMPRDVRILLFGQNHSEIDLIHQLSCILDSCTITASCEVSQAQKALLLLPREKGSSTSSEEHYANLPELTHEDVLQEH